MFDVSSTKFAVGALALGVDELTTEPFVLKTGAYKPLGSVDIVTPSGSVTVFVFFWTGWKYEYVRGGVKETVRSCRMVMDICLTPRSCASMSSASDRIFHDRWKFWKAGNMTRTIMPMRATTTRSSLSENPASALERRWLRPVLALFMVTLLR